MDYLNQWMGVVVGFWLALAVGLAYLTYLALQQRERLEALQEELSAQGQGAATNVTFADNQPSLPDIGLTLTALGKTLDMLNAAANENARYARAATSGYHTASGNYEQLSKDIGVLSTNGADMRRSIVVLTERVDLLVNRVVEVKNEVDMANQRLTLLAETLLPPMPAILPEPALRQAQGPEAPIKQTKPDVIADSFTMETPKQAGVEVVIPMSKRSSRYDHGIL